MSKKYITILYLCFKVQICSHQFWMKKVSQKAQEINRISSKRFFLPSCIQNYLTLYQFKVCTKKALHQFPDLCVFPILWLFTKGSSLHLHWYWKFQWFTKGFRRIFAWTLFIGENHWLCYYWPWEQKKPLPTEKKAKENIFFSNYPFSLFLGI